MNTKETNPRLNKLIEELKENNYKVLDSYDGKKEDTNESEESSITLLRSKNITRLMTKMYRLGSHIKLESPDKFVPILDENKDENGIKYCAYFKSEDDELDKIEKEISSGIRKDFPDTDYLRELRTFRCIESALLDNMSDHTSLSFEIDLHANLREKVNKLDNRIIVKTKENPKKNGYIDLKGFLLPLSAFLDFNEAKNEEELNTLKNTFGSFDDGRTLTIYLQDTNAEMIPGVISIINELEKTSKFVLLPDESEFYEESDAENLDDVSNVESLALDNSLSNENVESETEEENNSSSEIETDED